MCDCDFLPHYFIWSTEDTQQLYPNRLVGSLCVCKSVAPTHYKKSDTLQEFVVHYKKLVPITH